MGSVYVVGTFDTKGEELRYVRDLVAAAGPAVTTVDASTTDPTSGAAGVVDVPAAQVAARHHDGVDAVFTGDRGSAVGAMTGALRRFVREHGAHIDGIIGIGGSGGTALVTPAMRELPVGVPKVMVSTVASGDVAPYVGPSDIAMLYAVTDVAGLNRISRRVLGNAAHAVAGMSMHTVAAPMETREAIGLTMFGVTTPCVDAVRGHLGGDYDCLVFHATGIGGRAMEKLVDDGLLTGVLDISTTDVADLVAGGMMAATDDRFGATVRTGVPYVGSCGALDMVNFGAPETVPSRFAGRTFYEHNPQVTLMRTTADECAQAGAWIGERLSDCTGPVRFLIPEGGVSMIDAPGQPFHDPDADAALFDALERNFRPRGDHRLVRLPYHINEPGFAAELAAAFTEIAS